MRGILNPTHNLIKKYEDSMKKFIMIICFSFCCFSNADAETVKGYEIEPLNCIAALSIGRDVASSTGNNQLLRTLTEVQNNIYNSLKEWPKYSLIQARKDSMLKLGTGATEIMLSCINRYQ